MKVLILTQYYPPERGAPQNRLSALARSLKNEGADVSVLTAMPNYPEMKVHAGYRGKWSVREKVDGIDVLRSWILVSERRSIFWRSCNYFSFVFSSLLVGLMRAERCDVLLVESPPLFLGITAMWLARWKGARLVFNVSDLWPESAVKLGLVTNPTLIGMSTRLEMQCYRQAALITGQTQGIVENIKARCPGKNVLWVPNGIDRSDIDQALATSDRASIRADLGIEEQQLVLFYAGIIGHAQGLDVILRAAALTARSAPNAHFLLIGDGPVRKDLEEQLRQLDLRNVRFIDGMPRAELLRTLAAFDAAVVPLKRTDLFKGAIPSKIFEALALHKPLLLGVEGEAKELFIDQGKAGLCFIPEDAEDLARAVERYDVDRGLVKNHGDNGARYVAEHFDRAAIGAALCKAMRDLLPTSRQGKPVVQG